MSLSETYFLSSGDRDGGVLEQELEFVDGVLEDIEYAELSQITRSKKTSTIGIQADFDNEVDVSYGDKKNGTIKRPQRNFVSSHQYKNTAALRLCIEGLVSARRGGHKQHALYLAHTRAYGTKAMREKAAADLEVNQLDQIKALSMWRRDIMQSVKLATTSAADDEDEKLKQELKTLGLLSDS